MNPTATPKSIIVIVVYTLAFMSVMFLATLCYCVVNQLSIDPVFLPIGSGIVGSFAGLLINTRTTSPSDGGTTTTTTATATQQTTQPPTP